MSDYNEQEENNDFALTSTEQAVLLLIKDGMSEIPQAIFTNEVKDRLLSLKLIQFDDNPAFGWTTTHLGDRSIQTKIAIKYPLHVKGKVGDYDKIIKTMTDGAKDALVCAQVNNHFFDDLPNNTFKVLMQDMLNKGLFRKLGKELGNKWRDTLNNEYKDKA
jgi:hypothetical protein